MTLSLDEFIKKEYSDKKMNRGDFSLSDNDWEKVFEIVDRKIYKKISEDGWSYSYIHVSDFDGSYEYSKSELQLKIKIETNTKPKKESFINVIAKEYAKRGWKIERIGDTIYISIPMLKRLIHSIKMFFRSDKIVKN